MDPRAFRAHDATRTPRSRAGRGALRAAAALALLVAVNAGATNAVGQPYCQLGQCGPLPDSEFPRPHSRAPHPAVVRVRHVEPGGAASLGSGTVVSGGEGRELVVTCAHLFRDGVGQISVTFASGASAAAKLVALDRPYDLAALEVSGGRVESTATLCGENSPPGEPTRCCGYGASGTYREQPGEVVGYARAGSMPAAQAIVVSGGVRSGDSGGPIFDRRGELAGVLWGTDGRRTYGTCSQRIRAFLRRLRGRPSHGPERSPDRVPSAPSQPAPPAPAPPGGPQAESAHPPVVEPARPDCQRERQVILRLEQQLRAEQQARSAAQSALEAQRRRLDERRREPPTSSGPVPGSGALGALLGGKLTALLVGFGLPGWLATVVVWLVMRRGKKLLRKQLAERSAPPANRLNDDYARQLVEVFQQSGRSPVQDATLGREYDEELRRAEQSSDAALSRWARGIRGKVHDKFHRIHGETPSPAEPVQA